MLTLALDTATRVCSVAVVREQEILAAYGTKINPISGRISARYRKQVSLNLLDDFLTSKGL